MQQSNSYIIGFAVVLTVVLGTLLSVASVSLKDKQQISKLLDTKTQILSAVMPTTGISKAELDKIYNERIQGIVVNFDAQEVSKNREGQDVKPNEFALQVEIGKEFKMAPEDRLYPVFKFMNKENPSQVDAYILPLYGNGLWDNIWGYLAVKQDPTTKKWDVIQGVSFDHKAETPGLGARITTLEIQDRYKDKKLFDASGAFAVEMLKGESNNIDADPIKKAHKVDGMSGATITGNGVNAMMQTYIGHYKKFLEDLSASIPAPVVDEPQVVSDSLSVVSDSLNAAQPVGQ